MGVLISGVARRLGRLADPVGARGRPRRGAVGPARRRRRLRSRAAGGHRRQRTFDSLLLALVVAGFLGASVQSASGRAVMAWFPGSQRGLALGIRQTAIPISGFAASLAPAAGRARGWHRLGHSRSMGHRVPHGGRGRRARPSRAPGAGGRRTRGRRAAPRSPPLADLDRERARARAADVRRRLHRAVPPRPARPLAGSRCRRARRRAAARDRGAHRGRALVGRGRAAACGRCG